MDKNWETFVDIHILEIKKYSVFQCPHIEVIPSLMVSQYMAHLIMLERVFITSFENAKAVRLKCISVSISKHSRVLFYLFLAAFAFDFCCLVDYL